MLRRRVGFSLLEMLTVLALMAVLAAVSYPALNQKITESRAAALAMTLDGINESISAYRGNVGRLPRTLTQLSTKPLTGALDLCAATQPDVNLNQWRGPYTSRTFVTPGVRMADAMIQDMLRRDPATNSSTPFGVLYVDVTETDLSIAAIIEHQFDGTPVNYGAGTIRWVQAAPPAGPVGTLSFGIPVRGC